MPIVKEKEKKGKEQITEQEKEQWNSNQTIYGWQNAIDVAEEMWRLGNIKMLEGNLIFAYKNTTAGKKLYQIVISQNLTYLPGNNQPQPDGTYAVSIVTQGYSAALPRVPFEYLQVDVLDDLENYKVDERIIGTYKLIIENIEELYKN